MTCLEARRAIDNAIERDTPLGDARTHLTGCAACAERQRQLLNLRVELSKHRVDSFDDAQFAAIRASVMSRLPVRPLFGWRLGWALGAFVAAGSVLAGWSLSEPAVLPPLSARLDVPTAPEWALRPIEFESRPVNAATRRQPVEPPHKEREPEIRVAAIIPPDTETQAPGRVVLELESKNPNVVLYFMADYRGGD